MHFVEGGLGYIIPFLVVLAVLVFVHESGHYIAARLCGVKVETFSLGFGPELFGWFDRKGTRWKVSALPLGGYVKMFGDADAASTPGEGLDAMTPEERITTSRSDGARSSPRRGRSPITCWRSCCSRSCSRLPASRSRRRTSAPWSPAAPRQRAA